MTRPWVGLSLMPEDAFRAAVAPLFVAGEVEAVEWSVELGWAGPLSPWLAGLLAHYGAVGRLVGHGVHYSPLSATWEERQTRWLNALDRELDERSYLHFSEHYGFMTAPPFQRGAPLPPPRCTATLSVGRERLRRLRARLRCPLGLENLALAWNRDEALAHGAFLDALLEERDDFVVLDVHNLYCQAANFDLPADTLLASFPVERVREIHVSGGSWLSAWPGSAQLARCDTHDERVPEPVFELLRAALAVCRNARVVIFERLGDTLASASDAEQLREDFRQIREIVAARATLPASARRPELRAAAPAQATVASEAALASFQAALLELLAREGLEESAIRRQLAELAAFAPFCAETRAFDALALGVAARVARKWLR